MAAGVPVFKYGTTKQVRRLVCWAAAGVAFAELGYRLWTCRFYGKELSAKSAQTPSGTFCWRTGAAEYIMDVKATC